MKCNVTDNFIINLLFFPNGTWPWLIGDTRQSMENEKDIFHFPSTGVESLSFGTRQSMDNDKGIFHCPSTGVYRQSAKVTYRWGKIVS